MPVNLPLPHVKLDTDAQKLLVALPTLESRLPNKEPEIHYLRRFLRNRNLHLILKIYRQFRTRQGTKRPEADFAVSQAADVYCEVRYKIEDQKVRELLGILSKPHMQALLFSHDKIACEDYEPRIDAIPPSDREVAVVRIVRLIKNNEPLGATVYLNERTGCVEISRILHGGAAHRSGLLSAGDEIHEINSQPVKGLAPDKIVEMLSQTSGSITLKLVPCMKTNLGRKTKLKVRCLFNFDPESDSHIPCKEAGLSFKMGDILEIVSDEDSTWWQAMKVGEVSKPGTPIPISAKIIPSKHYQESVEVMRRLKLREAKNPPRSISPCRYSPRIPKQIRLRRTMYHIVQSGVFSEFDTDEIPTYEEVELYRPRQPLTAFRPLIFIGPPGVGRNELKRRLKASNPSHFEEVVPYTSREKREMEEDGKEYNFLSREEMENQIIAQKFVEYGEYKGNLYGTSLESIKSVIKRGKVCLLAPHTQALKFIRTPELRPFIVFIKAPSLESMESTRTSKHARGTVTERIQPMKRSVCRFLWRLSVQKTSEELSQNKGFSPRRKGGLLKELMPASVALVSFKHARGTVTEITQPMKLEELKDIVDMSTRMEERYSHMFDATIVNEDLQTAMLELITVAAKIEKEPQWVPAGWSYA